MAASAQSELELHGSVDLESVPCGHGARAPEASPFGIPHLAPSPNIACGACRQADRPLWWGICGWCGAEEEDFEAAA